MYTAIATKRKYLFYVALNKKMMPSSETLVEFEKQNVERFMDNMQHKHQQCSPHQPKMLLM